MQQAEQATMGSAFQLTPGLDAVVAHRGWCMARDAIVTSLASGPGVVALLGDAGTGKTLLLAEVARRLRQDGWTVMSYARGDLPFEVDAGQISLVDEAARMGDALQRFVQAPGARIVMAALPSFAERLEPLAVPVRIVSFERMTPDEAAAFVETQVERAGQPRGVFGPDAIASLVLHSGGIPRVLNQLARAAMFLASSDGRTDVTAAEVEESVALREGAAAGVALSYTGIVPDGAGSAAATPPAAPVVSCAPAVEAKPVLKARAAPSDGADRRDDADAIRFRERLSPPAPAVPPLPRRGLSRVALSVTMAFIVLAGLLGGSWTSWPVNGLLHHAFAPAMALVSRLTGAERTLPPQPVSTRSSPKFPTPAVHQVPAPPNPLPAHAPVPTPPPPRKVAAGAESSAPVGVPAAPLGPPGQAAMPTRSAEEVKSRTAPPARLAFAPPPAQPLPQAALPDGALPYVVLTYPAGNTVAARRAGHLVAELRAQGMLAADPIPIERRLSRPGIRYFFAEDHAVAEAVSRRLPDQVPGGVSASLWRLRMPLRPGTVEVSLPGS